MPDPTVSDGATFEKMVAKVAKSLAESVIGLFAWNTLHDDQRDYWQVRADAALTAAGVPDLLAALRAKDAEIERIVQENVKLLDLQCDVMGAEIRRYREALERITFYEPWAKVFSKIRSIARAALSEPAVEEEER